MVLCTLSLRIPGDTRSENITSWRLSPKHLWATERDRTKENWVGEEGKKHAECWPSLCQPPQGPVWPRRHSEKEHSSPSTKIHKVTKPIQRRAAWAGKRTNSHLDTRYATAEMPSSPGTPTGPPCVTLPFCRDFNLGLYVLGNTRLRK